jgi:hypothetical protein
MEPSHSPDGSIRIDWQVYDGRMSHVIRSPQIVRVATGEHILALGWDWDGEVNWLGNGNAFLLHLRRYGQGGSVSAMIDPANNQFRLGGEHGQPEPLADLRRRLEEETEKTVRSASPVATPQKSTSRFLAWVTLIVILGGVILWVTDLVQVKQPRTRPREEPTKTLIRETPRPTQ